MNKFNNAKEAPLTNLIDKVATLDTTFSAKLDHITITQAVNLDSLELQQASNTTNIGGKLSKTSHTVNKIFISNASGVVESSSVASSELDKLPHISVSQAVNLDTIETNSNASKVKTDYITVSQAVNLDTIETNSNASKVKADYITVSQAVDLDAIETNSNASKVKTDYITITQAVNLDTVESKANSALQNFNGLSTTSIFVGGGADKTANVDFSFVATAMNINPNDWKYLTLRTPTLSADKIIVLPSDAGTLQLVNGSGTIISDAERTKLSGIETSAKDDQTNAEIRALVESATDSNVFTDADHNKLNGMETSSTQDQTASEIRALVESASDSNVFTNADHTKLNGIEANAKDDQTNAEIRALVESATNSNVFTDIKNTKLNHITVNQAVNLDTMEGHIATNNTKTGITSGQISQLLQFANHQAGSGATPAGTDWFVTNAYFGCWNIYSAPSYGFLVMTTQAGSLPGYNSNYYPTIRTDYGNLYISVGGIYSGYFGTTSVGLIDFTGQHQALPVNEDLFNNVNDYIGKIVISNGDVSSIVEDESGNNTIETGKKGITINEAIPRVVLCNTYKDKRVFGVISPEEETENVKTMGNRQNEKHFRQGAFVSVVTGLPAEDNRIFINAVGEGAIWVINSHGNIENGDYICSSNKGEGYGCLQDDDLLHNYTCAKSTINCSFELESDNYECKEIIINDVVFKIAFIACTYCF